jgi:hypothetical protein
LTFFISPYEPLLQASNRANIAFKDVSSRFHLFAWWRIAFTISGAILASVTYALTDSWYFLGVMTAFFALIYGLDFVSANRLVSKVKLDHDKQQL